MYWGITDVEISATQCQIQRKWPGGSRQQTHAHRFTGRQTQAFLAALFTTPPTGNHADARPWEQGSRAAVEPHNRMLHNRAGRSTVTHPTEERHKYNTERETQNSTRVQPFPVEFRSRQNWSAPEEAGSRSPSWSKGAGDGRTREGGRGGGLGRPAVSRSGHQCLGLCQFVGGHGVGHWCAFSVRM